MNTPEILIKILTEQLSNLDRYEQLSTDAIERSRNDIARVTTEREAYRKQRSDLLQFCEENGIDLTEKK